MRPRLKDVAALAGVAPNTASTILNRRSNNWASQETVNRVFAAARELDYHPSKAALGIRLGRFNTLGLLIPDLANPYFCQIVDLMNESLDRRNYDLVIETTRLDPKRECRSIESIFRRQIDGAILCLMDPTNLVNLQKKGLPPSLLLSGSGYKAVDVDTVVIDYEIGLREAIGYAFGLGHRRFAYLSALAEGQPADTRATIFHSELAARGITLAQQRMICCGPTPDSAKDAFARQLFSLKPEERPTCIFALNDLSALGVIRAAAEFGIRVPEDISVVGVDDMPLGRFFPKALTTIGCDLRTLVEQAIEMLFARIDYKVKDESQMKQSVVQTVPTKLIIRETTAAPGA